MKRALILGVLCTLINFSSITEANSIKYLAESTSSGTSDSTGSGGGQGAINSPNANGDVNQVESANPEVELDGAIGPWSPGSDDMPNFEEIEDGDLIGDKPSEEDLFKISVTVPLNMNFVIMNEKGSSLGSFISPYYNITNNGTYPINVSFEEFNKVNNSGNSKENLSVEYTEQVSPLYITEPTPNNNKVEMRLSLNYDRPQQGTYFKAIQLHKLNESITSEEKNLGEIGSNETARIYYRSDLWETPKSEGIETDVVSNFNLILAFSTQNTNSGTGGTESGGGSGVGSDGSGENTDAQQPSGS